MHLHGGGQCKAQVPLVFMAAPRAIRWLLIPTMLLSLKVQYSKPKIIIKYFTSTHLNHFQISLTLKLQFSLLLIFLFCKSQCFFGFQSLLQKRASFEAQVNM